MTIAIFEKKIAIWLKTLSSPKRAEQRRRPARATAASQTALARSARRDRRPGVVRQGHRRAGLQASAPFLAGAVAAADLRMRRVRPAPPTNPITPAASTMTGKGTSRKKMPTKAAAASAQHHVVLERALADADHGFQHDREHRGLEAEEQRRNDPAPCRRRRRS